MWLFLLAFFLSIILTIGVRWCGIKWGLIDFPDAQRKQHASPTPVLGGLAIFGSFWLIVGYLFFFTDFLGRNIQPEHWLIIFIATAILLLTGHFDDRYNLSPKIRLAMTFLCALLVVAAGVTVRKITNPLGGEFELNLIFSNILAILWLVGMTYTTKISDGLDGLVTGVTAIGAVMIFLLSSSVRFFQPDVALVALVFAGALAGFLIFNFPPAKIFLGEGGSQFLGFILGVLAIAAGGKIATALLVMAVPILDLIRVIYVRLKFGAPVSRGDRRHLHFALLRLGLTPRQAVLLYYGFALIFGITTLVLQSWQKLFVLALLAVGMVAVSVKLLKENN